MCTKLMPLIVNTNALQVLVQIILIITNAKHALQVITVKDVDLEIIKDSKMDLKDAIYAILTIFGQIQLVFQDVLLKMNVMLLQTLVHLMLQLTEL